MERVCITVNLLIGQNFILYLLPEIICLDDENFLEPQARVYVLQNIKYFLFVKNIVISSIFVIYFECYNYLYFAKIYVLIIVLFVIIFSIIYLLFSQHC